MCPYTIYIRLPKWSCLPAIFQIFRFIRPFFVQVKIFFTGQHTASLHMGQAIQAVIIEIKKNIVKLNFYRSLEKMPKFLRKQSNRRF
jgi:hypothetical protein